MKKTLKITGKILLCILILLIAFRQRISGRRIHFSGECKEGLPLWLHRF